jgi:uncharacterized membrane protein YccC
VSKKETPPWLDFVQRFERAIGEPVESWVRSDSYFDLMTQMNRARQRFTKSFEDYAEQWLHLFNLPAASDVRRLREQLSRLERTVERMSNELDDRAEAAAPPPPPPPPRKRAPAKPRPKTDSAGGE